MQLAEKLEDFAHHVWADCEGVGDAEKHTLDALVEYVVASEAVIEEVRKFMGPGSGGFDAFRLDDTLDTHQKRQGDLWRSLNA